MKVFVSGASFNPEDSVFSAALAQHFQGRNYGEGLREIQLRMELVNISDYSGSLAQSPVYANGKIQYESTITIGSYYDVVTPSEYATEVMRGLEKLEYVLPKDIDFDTQKFLADAKQFLSDPKKRQS